jgi:putative transposase
MPRKPKAQPVELPAIPAELLEQFGNGPMTAEAINAATLALKKALIERALGGEMNHHLGYRQVPPSRPACRTSVMA